MGFLMKSFITMAMMETFWLISLALLAFAQASLPSVPKQLALPGGMHLLDSCW